MTAPASAYARALKKLLPPGKIWSPTPGSVLSKLCLAIGDELSRVDARGEALIEESDPRTATETLSDWESMLGLPDEDVTEIPATVAQRRLAITQKIIRQGGQTPAYFESLALVCGWVVHVVDIPRPYPILRAGFRAGDRCFGLEWAHVFRIDVDFAAVDALSLEGMKRIIRRCAPAHTEIIWNFL
jgi:uncharacterized protein YmfQ (DUF2313 family)